MKMKTENYLLTALMISIAVLFWLFGKSCGDVVDTRAAQKIDSVVRQAEAEKAVYRKAVDSIGEENEQLKRNLGKTSIELVKSRNALRSAEKKADDAIARYHQAKAEKDTGHMIAYCDTLAHEFQQYKVQVYEGQKISDSVIALQGGLINNQQSVIRLQEAVIDSSNKRINYMSGEFKDLDKKYQKSEKRKGNFWKGVATGFAAVFTILIVSK